jgi:hypothetical protein
MIRTAYLQIDFFAIQKIELDIIKQCIERRKKKGELGLLEKVLLEM